MVLQLQESQTYLKYGVQMKTKCVICGKGINLDKDDYFKAQLYIKGKSIGTDYTHRICWLERNNFNNQLSDLVSGVSNFAIKSGIIPEKKVIVA